MASATASASPQATSDSPENPASVTPCDCAIQRYEDHVAAIQQSSKKANTIDGKTKDFFRLLLLSTYRPIV